MLIRAQVCVISSSTRRSLYMKQVCSKTPTLYSLLLGSQSEADFFFFHHRVKRAVRSSSTIFHLQYICSFHCCRTPDSTNPSDSSAEPFSANNTPWAGRTFLHRGKEHLVAALQEVSLHLLYHTSTPVSSLYYFIFLTSVRSYYELLRNIA